MATTTPAVLTLHVNDCAVCTRPGRWRPADGTVTHGDTVCRVRQDVSVRVPRRSRKGAVA